MLGWLMCSAVALAGFPSHDEPLRTGGQAPQDAAVVIGIEDYFALPDVPYAERDARAFQDLLIYTVGVPTDHIQLITSDASAERIQGALAEAVGQVGSGGTLWVYFAGHGAASPSSGERVLLGIDTMASAESFEARSVSIPSIRAATAGVSRRVLLVDACYAGQGRAGGELLPGKRFAVPSYAMPSESSWVEWHAAQPNELSGPLEVARHGAFTWAVVGALRGWADGQLTGQTDGVVTLEEADLYVDEVLRTVEVTDQKPALQASDKGVALVSLPPGRGEGRPEGADLRAAVQRPVPAGSRPAVAAVATRPTMPAMPKACESVTRPQEQLDRDGDWAIEPGGFDPRATWTCKDGEMWLRVSRFPSVAGKSVEQLIVDNVLNEASRGDHKLKHSLYLPKAAGVSKSEFSETDPNTWPVAFLRTPRGQVTVYAMPIHREGPNPHGIGRAMAPGPVLAVGDDREPGAIFTCANRKPPLNWKRSMSECTDFFEQVLASDTIDPGIVR